MPRIRISAAFTFSHSPGQASSGQPCPVMSGCTPKAIGSVAGRIVSTATPLRRMISSGTDSSSAVCDASSGRFSVQLKISARRSEKSVRLAAQSASCCWFRAMAYAVAFISSRPISIRRISEVPAPISISFASRMIRLTGLSFRNPAPPIACTACTACSIAFSLE